MGRWTRVAKSESSRISRIVFRGRLSRVCLLPEEIGIGRRWIDLQEFFEQRFCPGIVSALKKLNRLEAEPVWRVRFEKPNPKQGDEEGDADERFAKHRQSIALKRGKVFPSILL